MTKVGQAQAAAITSVAIMFSTVAMLFYFWFFEKPYLTFENIPFPPQVVQVYPGEVIPLSIERCNSSEKTKNYSTSHALKNIFTGDLVLMPDVRLLLPPGCSTDLSLINRVPPEAPPGTYIVLGTADIPGTMREFHIDWHSEAFIVKEK